MHADAPLRAVVIGAGLAGLTAAHCLADGLFDEVTLLERDHVDASNGVFRPEVAHFAACEMRHCCAAARAAAVALHWLHRGIDRQSKTFVILISC